MMKQHSRPGKPHDLSDTVTVYRLITMYRAFRADGLGVAKGAARKTLYGVILHVCTILA